MRSQYRCPLTVLVLGYPKLSFTTCGGRRRGAWSRRSAVPLGIDKQDVLPVEVPAAINRCRTGATMRQRAGLREGGIEVTGHPRSGDFPAGSTSVTGTCSPASASLTCAAASGRRRSTTSDPRTCPAPAATSSASSSSGSPIGAAGSKPTLVAAREQAVLRLRRGVARTARHRRPEGARGRRVARAPSARGSGRKRRASTSGSRSTPPTTQATITLDGRSQTLRRRWDWSDWFHVPVSRQQARSDRCAASFGRDCALQAARASLLISELYLSPLNFHPDCHPIAFSWPPRSRRASWPAASASSRRLGGRRTPGRFRRGR